MSKFSLVKHQTLYFFINPYFIIKANFIKRMGNTCKCSCVGKTKDYINRELKKRKKPPRPEEYKIEEGKQVTDGVNIITII